MAIKHFHRVAAAVLLLLAVYTVAEAVKGPPIGEGLKQLSTTEIEEELQVIETTRE